MAVMSSFILWRIILLLLLLLQRMDMGGGGGEMKNSKMRRWEEWPWIGVPWGAAAAAAAEVSVSLSSPLSGTRIRFPWIIQNITTPRTIISYNYVPSPHDVFNDTILAKLLDVGACHVNEPPEDFSYVPPLYGSSHSDTVCQEQHGMRFVLYDLQLVNLAPVDALSGSFTAQLQLVFHWTDAWEQPYNSTYGAYTYMGDQIETADNASMCSFFCDSTSRIKCCDWMWVPPLQLPSCKINDVQSVTPGPYLRWPWPWNTTDPDDIDGRRFFVRRNWYVGLDVTCPFTSDFHNFPFDDQRLTIDIINPYASRTWLQLNHGFLQANIIDGISGINLSPDDKVDGWTIKDLIVSNACGTQQSWIPTFLTQDYLLQYLGVDYVSQNESIYKAFDNLICAGIKTLSSETDVRASLSNPANIHPYIDTRDAYRARLEKTIAEYEKCNTEFHVKFTWNFTINNNTRPPEIEYFGLVEDNINRSFNFLDFRYGQEPRDGVNFQCVIYAIANLTTPGIRIIRITIIIQRYTA